MGSDEWEHPYEASVKFLLIPCQDLSIMYLQGVLDDMKVPDGHGDGVR